jgi:hypothetical protein
MCASDGAEPGSVSPGNVAEALRRAGETLDYLIQAVADLPAAACGEALTGLGEIGGKLTAARTVALRRFDALNGHDADGYGSSSAWLAAMAKMSRRDAKATVRQMRRLSGHPHLEDALGRGEISESWAGEIAEWLRRLPAELRAGTEKILAEAAAAGASLEDLATITAHALKQWQAEHPDPDDDGDFPDRYVRVGTTFGGAGVIRGDLTPECAAAVTAVLEALGKKSGPEDDRTEAQRFHDALQWACELLMRAKMVPDRAGAGTMDLSVIDQMIELALAAFGHANPGAHANHSEPSSAGGSPAGWARLADLSPGARQALRYAIARLAIDLVSGPAGVAAILRQGLLEHPWNTPSLVLDIGWSDSIPAHIRKAVILRDRHCAWPKCHRPAAWCDVHHIVHKKDGGETSIRNCVLLCQFHHDVCIHRRGWRIILHPDGTTSVYGPRGQALHSHSPPAARVG